MKAIRNSTLVAILISFLLLNACNDAPKTDEDAKKDSSVVAKEETLTGPVYDPAIDALLVAPAYTKKLADTLGLVMFEGTLKPGDSLPMHSHPDHAFYVMDTSTALLYVPGKSKPDTLKDGIPGTGWVNGPFTDAARNIGKTTIRFLEVDVHRPRDIEMPAKPAYDSSIDAFTLGGPSIQKLADTLGIRMFVATFKPGDTATLHSHPDHTVYVLEGGELAVSFQGGPRQIMKLPKGAALVAGPLADAAKNTGKTTVKLLMTHIYRPRPK